MKPRHVMILKRAQLHVINPRVCVTSGGKGERGAGGEKGVLEMKVSGCVLSWVGGRVMGLVVFLNTKFKK